MSSLKQYTFFWSPEGKKLCVIEAFSLKEAKTEFKQREPQYAKYMGEVYWETKVISQFTM